jgi:hypothetical protein
MCPMHNICASLHSMQEIVDLSTRLSYIYMQFGCISSKFTFSACP